MKEYASTNIRNIALVGHGKSGKTSIAEDCLFNTGAIKRRGSIADGTMASDYEPEETRRELSIQTSLLACEWLDHKLNILDTPGYPDFVGEVKSALQAADSALVVISAVSGIEVETEKVWRYAEALDLPRAFFVNKIDREHADFQSVVNELRLRFGTGVVPIQLPVGKEAAFQGVVDLLAMTVRIKERDKNNCVALDEIPEYMKDEVEEARQTLIEGVAEINNTLLEKYIEGETLDEREVAEALIEGIETGKIFPVLCGSASLNVGMHALLNDMVEYLPAPTDRTVVGTLPGGEELAERTGCGAGGATGAVFLPVMETPSARTIVLIIVAFHLGSVLLHWSEYRIAWVSPACFLLLAACTWLLVRRWSGAMPMSAAWAVAVAVGAANGAQFAVIVSRPSPGWDHWTAGAGTFLACGLVLRGRGRQAWAAMALMVAGTTAWTLATGGSLLVVGAYNGGHVLTLALWSLTAMWSDRAYRAIGFQQRRLQSLRAQRRAEEETERVLMEARASVARRALPVLREIASGVIDEGIRTRARLLEAELRDEIRAACFTGTAVVGAARRARARGVDVVLLDDAGSTAEGMTEAPPPEGSERSRLVKVVARFLEGVDRGRVVVRVPPRSRGLLVVATRDGEIALSLRRG